MRISTNFLHYVYSATQRGLETSTVSNVPLVTTGELARELGVSRGAVLKWVNAEIITPEFTTPGGHHRWDVDFVKAQLAALRKREDDTD